MIVMMHFCGQGGLSSAGDPAVAFLGGGGRMAVNIFLLIGCWFMVDSPFRPERIAKLYAQVLWYSIPITLAMWAIGEHGSVRNVIQGLVPFFGRSVWFASAYISLIALSPFLNRVFLLSLRDLRRLMLLLAVLYGIVSTIPNFSPIDYVADFTWFCVVYLFVGWAKRERLFDRLPEAKACLALSLLAYCAVSFATCWTSARPLTIYWMSNIKSLPSFLIALFAFVGFLKLDIGTKPIVNFAARSVFAVYIVHQIPAFMNFEWHTIFKVDSVATMSCAHRAACIVLIALSVLLCASLVDLIRLRLEKAYLQTRPFVWLTKKLYALLTEK